MTLKNSLLDQFFLFFYFSIFLLFYFFIFLFCPTHISGRGETLLLLDGMVLDITRWLGEHPGGSSIIPEQGLSSSSKYYIFFHFHFFHFPFFMYFSFLPNLLVYLMLDVVNIFYSYRAVACVFMNSIRVSILQIDTSNWTFSPPLIINLRVLSDYIILLFILLTVISPSSHYFLLHHPTRPTQLSMWTPQYSLRSIMLANNLFFT